jgi:hypothetical protein
MSKAKLFAVAAILLMLSLLTAALALMQDVPVSLPPTISGIVLNTDGPVADAIVQVQGTANKTTTAGNGAFTLNDIGGTTPVVVTAWSAGHYIGWVTLDPAAPDWSGGNDIAITLRPLSQTDHSEYTWFEFEGVKGSASCGLCHREYKEWQADQHSQSAQNHRFLNIYTGTDINGAVGQPVQWGSDGYPDLPDPNQPYTGPGFVPDNPGGRAGNCATCHTPLVSTAPNTQNCAWSGCHTSLTIERANGIIDWPGTPPSAFGEALNGITCEFCHKTGDIILSAETGMPLPDMPGILSMRLYRPADEAHQIFFGTLVDVARERDSYLPLLSQSEFCAGCHFGIFGGVMGVGTMTGGVPVYNSYGEWRESVYSDPEAGKTCQDCHMPVSDADWIVTPERGGIERDYAELHDHDMLGVTDEIFMQNAVTMQTTAQRSGDQLEVEVSITNDKTGHHVPTDAPMRSMILVVEALDVEGNPLTLSAGPVNPDYSGDYAGVPGKTFAKVLRDEWTGETPTTAFWREVTIAEDTRIAAMVTDTTHYTFDAPAGAIKVNVRLLFRRAFYELAQQKGWNDPDLLMEQETLNVPAS